MGTLLSRTRPLKNERLKSMNINPLFLPKIPDLKTYQALFHQDELWLHNRVAKDDL